MPAEILEYIITFAFNDLSVVRYAKVPILNRIFLELYLNSIYTLCFQYNQYKKVNNSSWNNIFNRSDERLINDLTKVVNSKCLSGNKFGKCQKLISDYLDVKSNSISFFKTKSWVEKAIDRYHIHPDNEAKTIPHKDIPDVSRISWSY